MIRTTLDELNTKYNLVDLRQKGMLLAAEFEDADTAKAIAGKCFEKGLIIGTCNTGQIVKFIPP